MPTSVGEGGAVRGRQPEPGSMLAARRVSSRTSRASGAFMKRWWAPWSQAYAWLFPVAQQGVGLDRWKRGRPRRRRWPCPRGGRQVREQGRRDTAGLRASPRGCPPRSGSGWRRRGRWSRTVARGRRAAFPLSQSRSSSRGAGRAVAAQKWPSARRPALPLCSRSRESCA